MRLNMDLEFLRLSQGNLDHNFTFHQWVLNPKISKILELNVYYVNKNTSKKIPKTQTTKIRLHQAIQ